MITVNDNIKGLIFDIDGTLVDTMPVHYKAWLKVGKILNFLYPEELFFDNAGVPTTKIVGILNERLNLKLDPIETVRMKENFFYECLNELTEIKVVTDVVKNYYGKLPMSLGTGGRREVAQKTIEAVGIDKYFEIMVTAEDVTHHKPHPETFIKCAELMGVPAKDCLVFEDGDKGIEAAVSAGMSFVDIREYL